MKVVWSDEAVAALVALELRLAQRYPPERAARIAEELVRRVDRLDRLFARAWRSESDPRTRPYRGSATL